mmetsp:Transcript_130920/g.298150  ORF Transcript_130920/g.298150 Transcript_130920/m.298150 type:complete len:280 (+) Transcript_130920:301-1140(+)
MPLLLGVADSRGRGVAGVPRLCRGRILNSAWQLTLPVRPHVILQHLLEGKLPVAGLTLELGFPVAVDLMLAEGVQCFEYLVTSLVNADEHLGFSSTTLQMTSHVVDRYHLPTLLARLPPLQAGHPVRIPGVVCRDIFQPAMVTMERVATLLEVRLELAQAAEDLPTFFARNFLVLLADMLLQPVLTLAHHWAMRAMGQLLVPLQMLLGEELLATCAERALELLLAVAGLMALQVVVACKHLTTPGMSTRKLKRLSQPVLLSEMPVEMLQLLDCNPAMLA